MNIKSKWIHITESTYIIGIDLLFEIKDYNL